MARYKNPESRPPYVDMPLDAASQYVQRLVLSGDLHAHAVDLREVSGIHMGLAIIRRHQERKAPFKLQKAVDGLLGYSTDRTNSQYDLDALIASTAIEVAYLQKGLRPNRRSRALRSIRHNTLVTNSQLLHLTELGTEEPYKSIGASALLDAQEGYVDFYFHPTKLLESDGLVDCALVIGSAILRSQPEISPAQTTDDN